MTIQQVPFFQDQPAGQQLFTATGAATFTVPDDVFFISAVVVGAGGGGGDGGANAETPGGGGGALAWVAHLPVTPGENLTITVGAGGAGGATGSAGLSRIARGATNLVTANGGTNGGTTANAGATAGGTFTFGTGVAGVSGISTGGGNGGAGGGSNSAASGGGGGAGGYTGTGGAGGDGATASADGADGAGGGGGGGEASLAGNNEGAGGGGGVGLLGEGSNGVGGTGNVRDFGTGGSGGSDGTIGGGGAGNGNGGAYGGGGGGSSGSGTPGVGGNGAVRIIWGPKRFYPSTNYEVEVGLAATATSSAATITIPASAQAGDVAFLFDGASTSTTPTTVVPGGWVSIANTTGSSTAAVIRCISSYKILTSDDPGTSISGMAEIGTLRKTMLVFRPSFKVTSLTLSTPGNTATDTAPVAQTISLSSIATPVKPTVGLSHMFARTGDITGITITGDTMTQISNTTNQYVQYILNNFSDLSLNNVTVDYDDVGTNGLQSFYATFEGFYV